MTKFLVGILLLVQFVGRSAQPRVNSTPVVKELNGIATNLILINPVGLPSGLSTGVLNVKSAPFNAIGNGIADDTPAIQAAIDAGSARCQINIPTGVYKITAPLNITNDAVHIFGSGLGGVSKLVFYPSASGQKLINWTAGAREIFYGSIKDIQLQKFDHSTNAIALFLGDVSEIVVENVLIGSDNNWTGNNSIGLMIKGREAISVKNFRFSADLPIYIGTNPNHSISADHFWFSEGIVVGAGNPCIFVQDGANLSEIDFNDVSLNRGTHGFYWNDTTTVLRSQGLVFRHVRNEQAEGTTNWNFYISHHAGLKNLRFEGSAPDSGRNGYYLRNVRNTSIINSFYDGAGVALDTLGGQSIIFDGCFFNPVTTASFPDMVIRMTTYKDASGSPIPDTCLLTANPGNYPSVTIGTSLVVTNYIMTVAGSSYKYDNANVIQANVSKNNYFLGNSGNLTMTGDNNTATGFGALLFNTTGASMVASGYGSLTHNTTGSGNNSYGFNALNANTIGNYNDAFGYQSLIFNTIGNYNSAYGYSTLGLNISGDGNAAFGYQALYNNTATGSSAFGFDALLSNTTGVGNTGFGYEVLFSNSVGGGNTGVGYQTLFANTNVNNTAIGFAAMQGNISGSNNTASGYHALAANTSGSRNTANGYEALVLNKTGSDNVGVGQSALGLNTNGMWNVAIGYYALGTTATGADGSVAIGYQSLANLSTGTGNVGVGFDTLFGSTVGQNNTAIGYQTMLGNVAGNNNTAVGFRALYNATNDANSAFGYLSLNANVGGNNNTASGYQSLSDNISGNYNTAFGMRALQSNTTGRGNTSVGVQALMDVNILTSATSANTALGYNTGRGITTGQKNTIIGANVTGLSPTLANNVILADGDGNQRLVDNNGVMTINGAFVQPLKTVSASAIDWATGNYFSKTIAADTTFTFTGATAGQRIRVKITGDASHTVTWPVAVTWKAGATPTQTLSKVDFYILEFDGSIYYGEASQNF